MCGSVTEGLKDLHGVDCPPKSLMATGCTRMDGEVTCAHDKGCPSAADSVSAALTPLRDHANRTDAAVARRSELARAQTECRILWMVRMARIGLPR